jgi:hypothetical protein
MLRDAPRKPVEHDRDRRWIADVRREFLARGASLPTDIRQLVLTRVAEYQAGQAPA